MFADVIIPYINGHVTLSQKASLNPVDCEGRSEYSMRERTPDNELLLRLLSHALVASASVPQAYNIAGHAATIVNTAFINKVAHADLSAGHDLSLSSFIDGCM